MTRDAGPPGLDRASELKTLSARAAERWGDRVGLVFDGGGEDRVSLTFGDLDLRSNVLARDLERIGVRPGDRVGVMLGNRPEFPLAWLALAKLGAAMVPLNVYYKEADAGHVLEHSRARMAITSSGFAALLRRVQGSIPTLERILYVDGADEEGVENVLDTSSTKSAEPTTVAVFPETLASVQYTSGTTGRPKGCMLPHRYWITSAVKHVNDTSPPLHEGDVMLTAQPFYYLDPQWNLVTALVSGATLVVLDRFHPSTFWDKVREHEVTFFYCLGLMPALMLGTPGSPRDRENRVRHVACSAIPVPLHRQLEERWGAPWHESFGMTETGSDISVRPEEHDGLVGTGCIGRPKAGREARVIDGGGNDAARGEVGELVLRGTGMMDGYLDDPEATDAAFRGGWFHTGDLVRMDESGLLYYVGRKKEMIRRSGENVSAAEVEGILSLHPAVRSAACVGVPDKLRGQEVKAYVVLEQGRTREEVVSRELADFCSERLAYFKVPRYWEYRDELPRTPSERVAKHLLIDEKSDPWSNSYDRVDEVWR
jgi:crotonobetaine/carnitine-CoA ligase